jgi:hypothetical protein
VFALLTLKRSLTEARRRGEHNAVGCANRREAKRREEKRREEKRRGEERRGEERRGEK